jgi:Reverse transcriptase (RNA-dependent DNA polymerase)
VYKIKFRDNKKYLSHKARLVIKGFEQQYSVNYAKTFALVLKFATLQVLLAKAAAKDLEIDQIDVDTAFLNLKLKEEVYIEIPEFFELATIGVDPKQYCLRLRKALYKLKQTPQVWFLAVNAFFAKIGFKPSNLDPNLFVRNGVYILLFVDNIMIISKRSEVDHVKVIIKKK